VKRVLSCRVVRGVRRGSRKRERKREREREREKEQSTRERKPPVSANYRYRSRGHARSTGPKLKARSIDSHLFFFRALTRSRAPAEDDAENVREAQLQRPIRSVRWRRNGKYMPLIRFFGRILRSPRSYPLYRAIVLSPTRATSIPATRVRYFAGYGLPRSPWIARGSTRFTRSPIDCRVLLRT